LYHGRVEFFRFFLASSSSVDLSRLPLDTLSSFSFLLRVSLETCSLALQTPRAAGFLSWDVKLGLFLIELKGIPGYRSFAPDTALAPAFQFLLCHFGPYPVIILTLLSPGAGFCVDFPQGGPWCLQGESPVLRLDFYRTTVDFFSFPPWSRCLFLCAPLYQVVFFFGGLAPPRASLVVGPSVCTEGTPGQSFTCGGNAPDCWVIGLAGTFPSPPDVFWSRFFSLPHVFLDPGV